MYFGLKIPLPTKLPQCGGIAANILIRHHIIFKLAATLKSFKKLILSVYRLHYGYTRAETYQQIIRQPKSQ